MPDLGDVIELTVDIPGKNLYERQQGTIVHCYENGAVEVEFTTEDGETIDFLALQAEQFIVVWRAETKQWVSVVEQVSSLTANLPQERAYQVLDFARFLALRYQRDKRPLAKAA